MLKQGWAINFSKGPHENGLLERGWTNKTVKLRRHALTHTQHKLKTVAVAFKIEVMQLYCVHDVHLSTFDFSFLIDLRQTGEGQSKGKMCHRVHKMPRSVLKDTAWGRQISFYVQSGLELVSPCSHSLHHFILLVDFQDWYFCCSLNN